MEPFAEMEMALGRSKSRAALDVELIYRAVESFRETHARGNQIMDWYPIEQALDW